MGPLITAQKTLAFEVMWGIKEKAEKIYDLIAEIDTVNQVIFLN